MHTELLEDTCFLLYSHLLFQSSLNPKGLWDRSHLLRYKLLGGGDLSLLCLPCGVMMCNTGLQKYLWKTKKEFMKKVQKIGDRLSWKEISEFPWFFWVLLDLAATPLLSSLLFWCLCLDGGSACKAFSPPSWHKTLWGPIHSSLLAEYSSPT